MKKIGRPKETRKTKNNTKKARKKKKKEKKEELFALCCSNKQIFLVNAEVEQFVLNLLKLRLPETSV